MNALQRLPGWLLALVWLAVPAVALALVLLSLADDEDRAAVPTLGPVDVDVQTPALQAQREQIGMADCSDVRDRPRTTSDLPAIALPCLGGTGAVDLTAVGGPAVVNLWAQWCEPCREEMPAFQRLHERAGAVTVLGVNYSDLRPELALAFAGEIGVTYPSIADVDGALEAPLRLPGLPVTLFVDEAGELVATEAGLYETYAELAASVQEHLGVAA